MILFNETIPNPQGLDSFLSLPTLVRFVLAAQLSEDQKVLPLDFQLLVRCQIQFTECHVMF